MIAYACPDLMFATRIRATAESLGLPTVRWSPPQAESDTLNLLAGSSAARGDALPTETRLLLMDLDLGPGAIEAIRALKADTGNDQRQTLTIIAFGSHVDAESLRAARDAGADQALPRSVFVQSLKSLLSEAAGTGERPETSSE